MQHRQHTRSIQLCFAECTLWSEEELVGLSLQGAVDYTLRQSPPIDSNALKAQPGKLLHRSPCLSVTSLEPRQSMSSPRDDWVTGLSGERKAWQ